MFRGQARDGAHTHGQAVSEILGGGRGRSRLTGMLAFSPVIHLRCELWSSLEEVRDGSDC